ncbi:hypothetical protein Droror1_Dr00024498, partial [Drosera rotundifolia]
MACFLLLGLRVEAALGFAMAWGLRRDVGTYGVVIRRLVDVDETQFAERFYDGVAMCLSSIWCF